jgi:hypothetical protein
MGRRPLSPLWTLAAFWLEAVVMEPNAGRVHRTVAEKRRIVELTQMAVSVRQSDITVSVPGTAVAPQESGDQGSQQQVRSLGQC